MIRTRSHTSSSIEANLLIICSCLLTLKPFFQTVAPRVVGYSSRDVAKYGSNTGGLGSAAARGGLQTISSSRPKPHREHYHGFDEDEEEGHKYRMETLVEAGSHKRSATALGVTINNWESWRQ